MAIVFCVGWDSRSRMCRPRLFDLNHRPLDPLIGQADFGDLQGHLFNQEKWAAHQAAYQAELERKKKLEEMTYDAFQPGEMLNPRRRRTREGLAEVELAFINLWHVAIEP